MQLGWIDFSKEDRQKAFDVIRSGCSVWRIAADKSKGKEFSKWDTNSIYGI